MRSKKEIRERLQTWVSGIHGKFKPIGEANKCKADGYIKALEWVLGEE